MQLKTSKVNMGEIDKKIPAHVSKNRHAKPKEPTLENSQKIVVIDNREVQSSSSSSQQGSLLDDLDTDLISESPSGSASYSVIFDPNYSYSILDEYLNDVNNTTLTMNQNESADISNLLRGLEVKIDQIKENQEKMFRSLARIDAKVDALGLVGGSFERVQENEEILYPLKTLEEAIDLEEKLKDDVYFRNIIIYMKTKINRELRGINCCYFLVDLFFKRQFFKSCSWSGKSRSKEELDKYPFKSFRRIMCCFLHCIRQVDPDFTLGETEGFFKNKVIKYSTKRVLANKDRQSKIKHRPKGITCKIQNEKRKNESNGQNDLNRENLDEEESEDGGSQ